MGGVLDEARIRDTAGGAERPRRVGCHIRGVVLFFERAVAAVRDVDVVLVCVVLCCCCGLGIREPIRSAPKSDDSNGVGGGNSKLKRRVTFDT